MAAILGIHKTCLRRLIIYNKYILKKCVNQEYAFMKGTYHSEAQGTRAQPHSLPKKCIFVLLSYLAWTDPTKEIRS